MEVPCIRYTTQHDGKPSDEWTRTETTVNVDPNDFEWFPGDGATFVIGVRAEVGNEVIVPKSET